MNCLCHSSLLLSLAVQAVGANGQGGPKQAASAPVPIPRATFIANMNAEYGAMDVNKDGKVTKAEAEERLRATAAQVEQRRNQRMFQSLDTDRNGQLSAAEFARLSAKPAAPNGQPMMQSFDANRDGGISIVEYRTSTLANFDRMDSDKDGIVTPAEMRAAGMVAK